MSTLYLLLFCMLLVALSIILLAFKRHDAVFAKNCFAVISLISIVSFSFYYLIQSPGLNRWLNGGKEHYQLLTEFERLGGVKAAIASITAQLTSHPDDIQAWIILGKLYLADHNESAAQAAFKRARELQKAN